MTAIYLGYKYDAFEGIGAFSTATFLCKEAVDKFLEAYLKPQVKLFLYVGKKNPLMAPMTKDYIILLA